MDEVVISLPRLVNERWSHTLMTRLENVIEKTEVVVLDAKNVGWISPFGTVLLADFALKRLEENRRVNLILPQHKEALDYIMNSGLLKLTQSTTIRNAMDKNNIQLRLLNKMEPNVPEMFSNFVVSQAPNVGDDEKFLLRLWITELLTNANDHAKSVRGFWVCGRYDPIRRDIRICVADSGIGIKQSLVDSGKLSKKTNDATAIEKAFEKGMTSRLGKTGGLGLKHISSYVKSHGGSVTILSGKGKIYLARKKKIVKSRHQKYQGTIVNVAFDTRTISINENVPMEQTPFRFE